MSYKCMVCGKGSSSGNTISHSNRATKRLFRPNLQNLHVIIDGGKKSGYVCTACIKSNKVKKAV
ncbi:MAG: 50S ribosomal protein L28 [Elusimicrobiota bacterium]|jgi:large subunit ribosomal protein L28|nr:50S ribosomal protein L28 [Elusimicrobiota bacterium]